MCASQAEGDDLAQEIFLRAWRRLGRLQEPAAFGSWLRRMATRLFIDVRRIKRLEITDIADTIVDEAARPEADAGAAIDLERTLAALSPEERLCVVLKLGEGLSHAEIAELSGLPAGTVKSHVHRGMVKARKLLGEQHD
jgi:RNA polymerase sigma-70 factor (ECF subfamily)